MWWMQNSQHHSFSFLGSFCSKGSLMSLCYPSQQLQQYMTVVTYAVCKLATVTSIEPWAIYWAYYHCDQNFNYIKTYVLVKLIIEKAETPCQTICFLGFKKYCLNNSSRNWNIWRSLEGYPNMWLALGKPATYAQR